MRSSNMLKEQPIWTWTPCRNLLEPQIVYGVVQKNNCTFHKLVVNSFFSRDYDIEFFLTFVLESLWTFFYPSVTIKHV